MRRGSLAGSSALTMMQRAAPHQRSVDHVCDSAIASRESRARHRAKAGRGAGRRIRGLRGRLGKAAAAFTSNARNPNLRRAQLSFLGAWTAEWAFTVGARDRRLPRRRRGRPSDWSGSCAWLPSAILAPLLSPLADRGRRERVLILVSIAARGRHRRRRGRRRAVGPDAVVYALAVLSTIAATLYRPAHSALLPVALPHRLRARQRQRGPWAAGLRGHAGGSAAGRGAAPVHRGDVVFAVAAAASFWAAALLVRLRYDAPPRPSAPRGPTCCARPPRASARSAGTATWR